jgi:hypothetical protein
VRVGVGETGENGAAVEGESSGARRCVGDGVLPAAHERDAVTVNNERLGDRLRGAARRANPGELVTAVFVCS